MNRFGNPWGGFVLNRQQDPCEHCGAPAELSKGAVWVDGSFVCRSCAKSMFPEFSPEDHGERMVCFDEFQKGISPEAWRRLAGETAREGTLVGPGGMRHRVSRKVLEALGLHSRQTVDQETISVALKMDAEARLTKRLERRDA